MLANIDLPLCSDIRRVHPIPSLWCDLPVRGIRHVRGRGYVDTHQRRLAERRVSLSIPTYYLCIHLFGAIDNIE